MITKQSNDDNKRKSQSMFYSELIMLTMYAQNITLT